MRYQVSGRAPSIIAAILAILLALGMQLAAAGQADAGALRAASAAAHSRS